MTDFGIPAGSLKKKKKTGRPCKYSPDILIEICEQLLGSDLSIYAICHSNPERYPQDKNFWLYLRKNYAMQEIYLQCKAIQMHYLAEQTIDIAEGRDIASDFKAGSGHLENNREIAMWLRNKTDRDKLRIDTRLRLIGHLNRKVYGSATDLKLEEMKQNLELLKERFGKKVEEAE